MDYAKQNLDGLDIELSYSAFSFYHNEAKEYHFILNIQNPSLTFAQQVENINSALEYIKINLLKKSTSLVWCRYFLSDPVNQYEYLNIPDNCAVSITGQAPLNYAKIALWCYYIEGAVIKKESDALLVKRSNYDYLFYTGLFHSLKKKEYDQTKGVFSLLKKSFTQRNISFDKELVRTWIYVQGVDSHYKDMVIARKELFSDEGLTEKTHYITSTGIEGRYIYPESLVYMDAFAIKGLKDDQIKFLKALDYLSPTNKYGVTFERGTQIIFGDRSHIYISGTASIDKYGEIVAPHNILLQTQRTLENIRALLHEGNADFSDIAHLNIYLRDMADYPLVENYMNTHLPEIPKVFVFAPVCRPGWLIEMECMAITRESREKYSFF